MHGWISDIRNGLIRYLGMRIDDRGQVPEIYHINSGVQEEG
ncbi:hypothetical protein [Microbulbifer sp. JMSA002]